MLAPALSQFFVKANAHPDPPLQFPVWPVVLAASELDAAQPAKRSVSVPLHYSVA